jgi:predicted  nucleic acid-binding Zn-ribbon protein
LSRNKKQQEEDTNAFYVRFNGAPEQGELIALKSRLRTFWGGQSVEGRVKLDLSSKDFVIYTQRSEAEVLADLGHAKMQQAKWDMYLEEAPKPKVKKPTKIVGRKRGETLEARAVRLESELRTVTAAHEKVLDERNDLANELTEFDDFLTDYEHALKQGEELATANEELAAANQELIDVNQAYDSQAGDLSERIETLQDELAARSQELTAHIETITAKDLELREMEIELSSYRSGTAQEAQADLQRRFDEATRDLTQITESLEETRGAVARLTEENTALSQQKPADKLMDQLYGILTSSGEEVEERIQTYLQACKDEGLQPFGFGQQNVDVVFVRPQVIDSIPGLTSLARPDSLSDHYFIDQNGSHRNGWKLLEDLTDLKVRASKPPAGKKQKQSVQHNGDYKKLKKDLEIAKRELKTATARATDLDSILTGREREISSLQSNIHAQEESLTQLRSEYDTLQAQHDEANFKTEDYDRLHAAHETLTTQCDELTSQQDELRGQYEQIVQTSTVLEQRVGELEESLSQVKVRNEELESQELGVDLSKLDSPEQLFELYLIANVPSVIAAAKEYDSLIGATREEIRNYAKLCEQTIEERLIPFLTQHEIVSRDLKDIRLAIDYAKKPFEETIEYAELKDAHDQAQTRIQDELELQGTLKIVRGDVARKGIISMLDSYNISDERAKIQAFVDARDNHQAKLPVYTQLEQILTTAESEIGEARAVMETIRDRTYRGVKNICMIRQEDFESDYSITFTLPFDDTLSTSPFVANLAQCVLNPEFLSEFMDATGGDLKNNYQLTSTDGLIKISYNFPKDNVSEEQMGEIHERVISRLRETYLDSKLAALGFTLEVLDFKQESMRLYAIRTGNYVAPNTSVVSTLEEPTRAASTLPEITGAEPTFTDVAPEQLIELTLDSLLEGISHLGVDLDSPAKGSNHRQVSDIATDLFELATELGITPNVSNYPLTTDSAKSNVLIYLAAEVFVATNGLVSQMRRASDAQIEEFFPGLEDRELYSILTRAYVQLAEQGIIEKQTPIPKRSEYRHPQRIATLERLAFETQSEDFYVPRIMSGEDVCALFEQDGVNIDSEYLNSGKSMREVINQVCEEAAEVRVCIDPSIYNTRFKLKDRDVMKLIFEVEIAKNLEKPVSSAQVREKVVELFPDTDGDSLHKLLKSTRNHLANVGYIQAIKSNSGLTYVTGDKRVVTDGTTPIPIGTYFIRGTQQELTDLVITRASNIGIEVAETYNSKQELFVNFVYTLVAETDTPLSMRAILNESGKYFPNATLSSTNKALEDLESQGLTKKHDVSGKLGKSTYVAISQTVGGNC